MNAKNKAKRKRKKSITKDEEKKTLKSSNMVRCMTGERPPSLVKCPVCGGDVKRNRINEHLDNSCHEKNGDEGLQDNAPKVCQKSDAKTVANSDHKEVIVIDDHDDDQISRNLERKQEIMEEKMKNSEDDEKWMDRLNLALETASDEIDPETLKFRKSFNPFGNKFTVEIAQDKKEKDFDEIHEISESSEDNSCNVTVNQNMQLDFKAETHSKERLESRDDLPEYENGTTYEPYYWANFKLIMNSVVYDADNLHLFNDQDSEIVGKFKSLDEMAQQLYVRLFLRKNSWLKVDKLSYPRIAKDLKPVIGALMENGFVDGKMILSDLNEVLGLMSAPEVRSLAQTYQLFKDKNGGKLSTKKDLVNAIINLSNNQKSVISFFLQAPNSKSSMKNSILKRAKNLLGDCLKTSQKPREVFNRCFSLFSLVNYSFNDDDNINSSLIYRILQINKGEMVFPSYKIRKLTTVFKTRGNCIEYTHAVSKEEEFQSAMEVKDFDTALSIYKIVRVEVDDTISKLEISSKKSEIWSTFLPVHLRRFSSEWVLFRICSKSVEALEKRNLYLEAVELLKSMLRQTTYCLRSRGAWWDRLAIDTERYLKDPSKALDYIKIALDDPWVRTGMRLNLVQRAKRICSALKNKHLRNRLHEYEAELLLDPHEVTISAPVFLDTSSSHRAIFLLNDSDQSSDRSDQSYSVVEEYALSHYKEAGFPNGVHAEGSSYTFIFSLLFWDVIFMDIDDAFLGPYQPCPLDLCNDQFYEMRKETVDKKLQEIRDSSTKSLRITVQDSWLKNEGKVCLGCNWNIFENVEQVMDVVTCLKSEVIAGICEIFSKDYRNRCSGMPDLLVWNASSQKCKAVEVKGPGDRLSNKQIIWLNILTSIGMDAEVCYIKGVGGKKRRVSKV